MTAENRRKIFKPYYITIFMDERVYRSVKKAVALFCHIQDTRTKDEAFLKGLLFGLGGEKVRPRPNWELLMKNPEMMMPIERDISDIYDSVMNDQIEVVEQLFKEIYEQEGREIPRWLKDK